jgi:hypothetical protein
MHCCTPPREFSSFLPRRISRFLPNPSLARPGHDRLLYFLFFVLKRELAGQTMILTEFEMKWEMGSLGL